MKYFEVLKMAFWIFLPGMNRNLPFFGGVKLGAPTAEALQPRLQHQAQ